MQTFVHSLLSRHGFQMFTETFEELSDSEWAVVAMDISSAMILKIIGSDEKFVAIQTTNKLIAWLEKQED